MPRTQKDAILVRCSPEQHRRWEQAAAASERSLSQWMRYLADREAVKQIKRDPAV